MKLVNNGSDLVAIEQKKPFPTKNSSLGEAEFFVAIFYWCPLFTGTALLLVLPFSCQN